MFEQARKFLLIPNIIVHDMSSDIKQKVISKLAELIKEENSCFQVCKKFVEHFEMEIGSSWVCVCNSKGSLQSFFTYEPGFLITLSFGDLLFKIHKRKSVSLRVI